MAIGINDLDDDDLDLKQEESNEQNYNQDQYSFSGYQTETSHDDNDSFISDFLKTRGIDDISKIKFEDEQGNIE